MANIQKAQEKVERAMHERKEGTLKVAGAERKLPAVSRLLRSGYPKRVRKDLMFLKKPHEKQPEKLNNFGLKSQNVQYVDLKLFEFALNSMKVSIYFKSASKGTF